MAIPDTSAREQETRVRSVFSGVLSALTGTGSNPAPAPDPPQAQEPPQEPGQEPAQGPGPEKDSNDNATSEKRRKPDVDMDEFDVDTASKTSNENNEENAEMRNVDGQEKGDDDPLVTEAEDGGELAAWPIDYDSPPSPSPRAKNDDDCSSESDRLSRKRSNAVSPESNDGKDSKGSESGDDDDDDDDLSRKRSKTAHDSDESDKDDTDDTDETDQNDENDAADENDTENDEISVDEGLSLFVITHDGVPVAASDTPSGAASLVLAMAENERVNLQRKNNNVAHFSTHYISERSTSVFETIKINVYTRSRHFPYFWGTDVIETSFSVFQVPSFHITENGGNVVM